MHLLANIMLVMVAKQSAMRADANALAGVTDELQLLVVELTQLPLALCSLFGLGFSQVSHHLQYTAVDR